MTFAEVHSEQHAPFRYVSRGGHQDVRCAGCGSIERRSVLMIPGDPSPQREVFAYAYCEACETLTFADHDVDPGRYYGEGYYSLASKPKNPVKHAALAARDAATLYGPDWLSGAVCAISEHPVLPRLRPILQGEFGRRIGPAERWLDIGCGAGALLKDMRAIGFSHLTGVDPFMRTEADEPGLRLCRGDIQGLSETFDAVMMHHSLEHVPDPEETLRNLHPLVAPGGVLLIRIPVCGSDPWRMYGGEWGNLDAPRHLVLWGVRGFISAATRARWVVRRVDFDSKARSLYSGEARLRGHSEHAEDVRRLFTPLQIAAFEAQAREMNRKGAADSAAFYLTQAD